MTLGDILFLLSLCAVSFIAGRISMMNTIVRAVINESENQPELESGAGTLKIEKIGEFYYAYVDSDFAGQSKTFDDLFTNMAKNKKFAEWKMKELPDNLTDEEKTLLVQAIAKNFTPK